MTCIRKSLNISLEPPLTEWHSEHLPLPKKMSAPFFWAVVIARSSPRAKRSMGALAKTRVNSNSAIALPNIEKSIGAPAATSGKILPNRAR
jgi:hypothetical protein